MKLLRYGPKHFEKPAVLDDQGHIRDLSAHISDIAGATLLPESLARLRQIDIGALPLVDASVRIGACVGAVGKFIGIGLNYVDHAKEAGLPIPSEPIIFNKWTSSIQGPNDPVVRPRGAEKVDWEVELGVVIGLGGSYISAEEALHHVAGYCVVNDVSERAYQMERGGTWDKGKGCDTFGPIGPWLVTRDEVPDAQQLELWLDVDGERMQSGNTQTMIFNVPSLIAYVSQFMRLHSGDIISTGTPPGVGAGFKPPRFLRVGQTMRLGIHGLGEQNQRFIEA